METVFAVAAVALGMALAVPMSATAEDEDHDGRREHQPASAACIHLERDVDEGHRVRVIHERESCGRGETRMPVVDSRSASFFGDGSTPNPDSRSYTSTLLVTTMRVPPGAPLVIQTLLLIGGDPMMGPLGTLMCGPLIDGRREGVAPFSPSVGTAGEPPVSAPVGLADLAPARGSYPAFPDFRWQGLFTAPAVSAGEHTFSLTCESDTSFQMRGSASLTVLQDRSRR